MEDIHCLGCHAPFAKGETVEGTLVLVKGTGSDLVFDRSAGQYFIKCASCGKKNGFREFACEGEATRFVQDRLL